MRQPDEIEAMLSKLMPTAISEEGRRSMDELLDELCGPEIEETAPVIRRSWKWMIAPAGIAAATALAFILPEKPIASEISKIIEVAPVAAAPEIVLVNETDRIESLSDEGLMSDSQGEVMQAVRVRVVEENTFRDEETGIVMQISAPREELLLYQVDAF